MQTRLSLPYEPGVIVALSFRMSENIDLLFMLRQRERELKFAL